jgi:hypothetical protein
MYLGQDAEQRLDVSTTKAMVLPLIAFWNGAGQGSKRAGSHPSGRHRHLKNSRLGLLPPVLEVCIVQHPLSPH